MPQVGTCRWRDWSVDVRVVTADPAAAEAASVRCRAVLAQIGDVADRFRPDSELSAITGHTAEGVRLSEMLTTVLRGALQTARDTSGAVDPTVGSSLRALGYTTDIDQIDSTVPVPQTLPSRTWRDVELSGNILCAPDDVVLDFGATAKAIAADLAAERAAQAVGCGVLISLGGDLASAGPEPVGGWRVLVQDAPGEPGQVVVLRGRMGLATSSMLHRVWARGGQRVGHILNPRTGLPVSPVWRTVSVLGSSCLGANAWSTASFVWGNIARDRLGLRPARLVDCDGQVFTTPAWELACPGSLY